MRLFFCIVAGLIVACACNRRTAAPQVSEDALPLLTENSAPAPDTLPAPPAPPLDTALVIALKRSGCFGRCPVFEAQIHADGRAFYRGIRFAPREGFFEARISTTQIEIILTKALEINFLSLKSHYPENGATIVDLPDTVTQIRLDGQLKIVTNNFDAPRGLVELERLIDATLEQLDWVQRQN